MTMVTPPAAPPLAARGVAPVVTGLGVVAPNGLGVAEYWAATLAGRSGITRITRFDPSGYRVKVFGQVDIDPGTHLPSRLLPQTDLMTRLALIAADEALSDAAAEPRSMPYFAGGVVTAASGGGFDFGQRELEALWSKGSAFASAYQSFAWFYPVNTGQISIRHALHGPGAALVSEQAGGIDAVAKARRGIRGGAELMIGGGVDGSLCPWSLLCMTRSGRLSECPDPERAFRPYDVGASGAAFGEGGALLVMEHPDAVRRRGVTRTYGTVAGYGSTFDPRPGSGREPGLRRAIERALADAAVTAAEVDVVFADAAGLPELDRAEVDTLNQVFGPGGVPVTAPKSMTGRLLGGGASLDLATAFLALRHQIIPPTVHVDQPAYPDLDLVRDTPRRGDLAVALVVARGHGGFNSAMVLRAPADS
ncbi:ketosynthase chain-length factor [Actinoplanes sp. NPDC026619]|uniref:ketosynthase chain-length factor n=1 Tax=Actinoplanes sp. NPDC026619 TaxID=3155798 RepID=UPI0033C45682